MWGVGRLGRVSDMDILLAQALHSYESGLCKGCGLPLGQSTSGTAHPMDFRLDSVTCEGCVLMKSEAASDPDPGELIFIQNDYGQN